MAQHLCLRYEHTDQINTIVRSSNRNIIVTGGNDGSILIRDSNDFTLKKRIPVGYLPVNEIAVNPKYPVVAIFQTDNIEAYYLRVIDYEKVEELYSFRLKEKPLFIGYSGSGNYLLYSNSTPNGLTIIDYHSGAKKNWLTEIETIVPTAEVSPDDSQMVTYSTAGSILFFGIKEGQIRKIIPCMSNLENPLFVMDGRFLIGNTRDKIVAIETASGKAFNEIKASNIIKMSADNKQPSVLVYSTDDGYAFLQQWNYGKRNSKLETIDPNQNFSIVSAFLYHNSQILCATTTGKLFGYSTNKQRFELDQLKLQPFTGIACSEGELILTDNDSVFTIPLHNLDSLKKISSIQHSALVKKRPFLGDYKILLVEGNQERASQLFYQTSGNGGAIYQYQPSKTNEMQWQKVYDAKTPIAKLKSIKGGFLGLTQSGGNFILDQNFNETFNYDAFGTRDIAFVKKNQLVAGRAKDSLFKSTLVKIDAYTGETVPMQTNDLITFDINYNPELLALFTIGIENRNGKSRTILKSYRGEKMDRVDTLLAVPGEDHKATILYDPQTAKVYTTLGTAGIRIIQWGGFTTNQKAGHIPASLAVNSKLLFALNQDGSVTAWNKKNGKEHFTLYQFDNDAWISLAPEEKLPYNEIWNKYRTE